VLGRIMSDWMIAFGSSGLLFLTTISESSANFLRNSESSDRSWLTSSTIELSSSLSFFRVLPSTVNWPWPIIRTIFLTDADALFALAAGLFSIVPFLGAFLGLAFLLVFSLLEAICL